MMRVLVVISLVVLLVGVVAATDNYFRLSSPFAYACIRSLCVKQEKSQTTEYRTLEACQLTCGEYGSMWPKPTGEVQLSKKLVHFNPENMQVTKIAVSDNEVAEMLGEATRHFKRNVHFLHPDFPKSEKTPYTEEEKVQFTQSNQQEGVQQRRQTPFGQEYQQQTNQEFGTDYPAKTFENWERHSPFHYQKSNRRNQRQKVDIEIAVNTPEKKLSLDTDESYNLEVTTVADDTTVKIQAPTYFGARHALESLSQLIAYDETNGALMIVSDALIQDEPQFKYRGFMLDTSRNYYPKEDLMRLLDAMSQNKMNYFQWHITDAASFPMYTDSRPEMAYYGAYSTRKVYYPQDIQQIVEYANLRGINVIPEINGPGHTAAGWEWGEASGKGKLVLCTGSEETQEPWYELGKEPPSGQLNPVNPEVYNVLGAIYADVVENFDPIMVHMGGDDVSFKCWQNSNDIKEYLAANAREANSPEFFKLWNEYQDKAYSKLQESAGPGQQITPIIHSSSFASDYIDKEIYIIQVNEFANDSLIASYVNNGYRVIFSNLDQWRVDCAGTNWVGEKSKNCPQEIPTWEQFYYNSPLDMLTYLGVENARSDLQVQEQSQPETQQQTQVKDLVLGGTASLYSSETDPNGIQAKVWPRVSAMAERLWTDPVLPLQGIDTTQKRLNTQRQRMVLRGIRADPLHPEICTHDESACYSEEQYKARSANIPALEA